MTIGFLVVGLLGIGIGATAAQGTAAPGAATAVALPPARWTAERAWAWYRRQTWIAGFNYVPSTACNTTEFWSAETFDPKTIDRELGWAQRSALIPAVFSSSTSFGNRTPIA